MRFTPKKITILIMGIVFTAGLAVSFVIPAFAADDYNSSRSNTSISVTNIPIVNKHVGDVLLRFGIGGAEINEVTDALAQGISTADLKAMLIKFGVSDMGIQEVLTKLDELGAGADSTAKESATGEVVPAPAAGVTQQPARGIIEDTDGSQRKQDVVLYELTESKKIELMQNTIGKIQERLMGCDTKVCITVGDHAKYRAGVAIAADKAVKAGKNEEAVQSLLTVKKIVEGDIELLAGAEDKGLIADVLGLERALLHQTDSALTDLQRSTAGCKNDSQCSAEMVCFKGSCIPAPPVKGGGDPLKGLNISHACPKGGCPKKEAFHDTQTDIIQNIRAAAPEERESLKEELKANREAFQTEIVSMSLTTRENAKALRENFRENVKTTIGHVDHGKTTRIAVAHGKGLRMLNRFRSAMARFDHILGRLESRIEKMRIEIEGEARSTAKIKDTFPPTNTAVLIEKAKNMSVENEAKMEELKAKYESLLLGENAGGVAEEARALATELKTDIENLRAIIIEIHTQADDYNSSRSNTSI
ncbi:MAG: hypothetical protein Q8O87_00945 [bacterium]|nr:hypothetical protein [bacterium]